MKTDNKRPIRFSPIKTEGSTSLTAAPTKLTFPGYPMYVPGDDIYKIFIQEKENVSEETKNARTPKASQRKNVENDFSEDNPSEDLDFPNSELEDSEETNEDADDDADDDDEYKENDYFKLVENANTDFDENGTSSNVIMLKPLE